jgi:hypothetical protein
MKREFSNLRQQNMVTSPKRLGPENDYTARTSIIYKTQTRPLVREDAPQKQDHNCQEVINISSCGPDEARYQDWPSVANVNSNFTFEIVLRRQWEDSEFSCETLAGRKVCEDGNWRSYGVESRYQATTGEHTVDWEDLLRAVVNCRVRELAIVNCSNVL